MPTPRLAEKIRRIAAGLTVLCAAQCAMANGLLHPELSGSYVGLTYPQTTSGSPNTLAESELVLAHEDDTAVRLTLGHPWAQGLHLEYGLQQMRLRSVGESHNSPVSMQAGSISTMLFLPGAGDIYPFVKFGIAAISAGSKQDFVGTTIGSVGFIYPFMKGWSARFELERIDKFGASGKDRTQAYAGIQIPL